MASISPVDAATGVYFDGETSSRRTVALAFETRHLVLCEDGREIARWPWSDLRRIHAPRGLMRLASVSAPTGARLDIAEDAVQHMIAARATMLDASARAERGTLVKILAWSLAAAASVAGLAVFGMPLLADRITPLVPASFERRLGDAADKQLRALFVTGDCLNGPGRAALDKLARSVGHARETGTRIFVVRSESKNAIALPGRIYILEPLLAEAASPDGLAGVLAHELGHVAHRDGLRRVIQNGGASFLFGLLFADVFGAGVVVFASQWMVEASHSREAESAADAYARARMEAAGRPAKPLGDFLLRMTGERKSGGFGLFSSHPYSEDRRAVLGASTTERAEPLLSDREWRDLKAICRSGS